MINLISSAKVYQKMGVSDLVFKIWALRDARVYVDFMGIAGCVALKYKHHLLVSFKDKTANF